MRDEDIIARLKQSRPEPNDRFYQKMDAAPWKASQTRMVGQLRLAAIPAALLLAAVVAIWLMPVLRAAAQDIIRYFERSEDDQHVSEWVVPTVQPTLEPLHKRLQNRNDLYTYTIEDASEIAGFDISFPAVLPDDFRFVGARVFEYSHFVALRFEGIQRHPHILSFEILLTHNDSDSTYVYEIGPEAEVEEIPIGDTNGEYVRGSWSRWISESPRTPGETASVVHEWTDSGGQTLIWQMGDVRYHISSRPGLGRDDMIGVARCMYINYDVQEPHYRLEGYNRYFEDKSIECQLETGIVIQTYPVWGQFLMLRQQPLDSAEAWPPVVDGEVVDTLDVGDYVEGQWIADLPSNTRGMENLMAQGLRWQSNDLQLELWLVGEARAMQPLERDTLLKIAASVE